ncbi:phosphatase PAP2 family protein [Hymenobacter sp. BT523]|uniref:phosphatase PAP2 family protein n=1 Tax=Hymenobacter sp. BT523 TaxID=2795725 RepID=UPI0018ED026B|nr:phosphatase PAP2 family protein [Hymenobacter sp. BT523]MBJ6110232.1 phosphatase PAP2 family protein [Hymenobacter sp. BT523]
MKTTVLLVGLSCLLAGPARAQMEPTAGEWKTWVIPSGAALAVPPPPSAKATRAEAQTVLALAQRRDSASRQLIRYWNAGAPGYRWQAISESLLHDPVAMWRAQALMNIAIYDATVAAWHAKYAYRRPGPDARHAEAACVAHNSSPSYPSEHAVAAGAASAVLAALFPAKADSLRQLAADAGRSRILAGVAYPSDVDAGFELGQRVAAAVLERAKTDSCDAVWKGAAPTQATLWHDKRAPVAPMRGHWRPFVLTSGRQFRPGPPPDYTADMQELKMAKRTPATMGRAFYWASNDYWGEMLNRKLFETGQYLDAPRAARAYALLSVAAFDAGVACWDAKFSYWGIRPDQYDPSYQPVLPVTPPFPGYPSGHATLSCARGTVLSYLFPEETQLCDAKAHEAAESRFDGGIHFRTDNIVGLALGKKVGLEVVKRARQDGADAPAPRKVASR